MAPLTINDVRKSYGALEVLHGVSIDIDDGEFVVLVGPSGCGKSTLLRMLAGLEDISSGEVAIGGRVVNALQPKERDIAMVFQSYALYPHMTVEQNMGFSLKLARAPKQDVRDRVLDVAKTLNLEDYLQRYPRQLSGGQRQRVAMGRAMVRNPEVFLFDEPLSNLDAKLRVQMRSEIKQNHHRLKTTTVYVTHDQVEAMTMADKIVVMNAGRVEQVGSPLELYDRPANIFVAGFIGSPAMNLIAGRIVDSHFLGADGTRMAVPASAARLEGHEVKLGIRPEHLVIDPQGHPAEILTVEPTGAETLVLMQLAGHEVVGVFRERITLAPGKTLSLSLMPDHIHLFDTQTGLRIPLSPEN